MVLDTLHVRLAMLGGIGGFPYARGTLATIVAGVPCAWLLGFAGVSPALFLVVAVFFLSCYTAELTERDFGREDPQEIVIDELTGFLVTMVALPVTAKSLLLGIAAFRLFDIWKPWPICLFHTKIRGGLGIVMDDVAAGIYARILVWSILQLWP